MAFSWIESLQSTTDALTKLVFYLQLTSYIHKTRSPLNNCWVLVDYQTTIHNKCSKSPPLESLHTWTRLIMDCRILSNVLGRLRMALQAAKLRCWSAFLFSIGPEYSRVFEYPHRQKYKRLRSGESDGLYLEHCLRSRTEINFFPCFDVQNSLVRSVHAVEIHAIYTSRTDSDSSTAKVPNHAK